MPEIPIREAAFQAIATALAGLTLNDVAVTIERNNADPVPQERRPCLVLMDGDMDPDSGSSALYAVHRVHATLAGFVTGGTQAEASAAINLLHALAMRALMRPNGVALLPAPLPLGDNNTVIWIEDGPLRVSAASVLESEAPYADFTTDLSFTLEAPWGNPFITLE